MAMTGENSINRLPIAVLDIHNICNQQCSYCVTDSSPTRDYGPLADSEASKDILQFFEDHGPFNVLFTGGEPLITPGISTLFQSLVSLGHRVSLQSNLKAKADVFLDVVAPDDTGWVLASFHSVAIDDFDKFKKKVTAVKASGYPVVVKFLLDDDMIVRFAEFHDELAAEGVGVMCSPIINYPATARPYPRAYTAEQWSAIAPRISLLSSWLFFAGGWKSHGAPCYAGNKMFYFLAMHDGAINGCSSGSPAGIGNLFSGEFLPRDGLSECQLESCICDFHYYSGIIPNLDDSGGFEKLTRGQVESVSFSEYLAWVKDVQPNVDLKPVLGAIGNGFISTADT